jgi:hypothetical protein
LVAYTRWYIKSGWSDENSNNRGGAITKSKIRSVERLNQSIVRWEFLDDCFPNKERPTDIDGAIEKKGHILLLEHKGKGARISRGQSIFFREFSKKPNCKVFVFFGAMKNNIPQDIDRLVVYEDGLYREVAQPSIKKFKDMIREWRSNI